MRVGAGLRSKFKENLESTKLSSFEEDKKLF
jgi:hypothetical protein